MRQLEVLGSLQHAFQAVGASEGESPKPEQARKISTLHTFRGFDL